MTTVLIAGGGPVGLATGIQARLAGLEAILVDAKVPPIDKACGEGLMPSGVKALQELGIEHLPSAPFKGIRYLQEDRPNASVAVGQFGAGEGWGIRRLALHKALVERAEQLGVQLRWGVRILGLTETGLRTSEGDIEGDWIVGADGLNSSIRKWANLEGKPAKIRRYGLRRHYAQGSWSDHVEVYWANGCEAYVTPNGPTGMGVAILWDRDRYKPSPSDPLAPFPSLKERLQGIPFASISRGAGPLQRNSRAVQRGRVLLVGDAAGYVDAITGEGLTLGFHQAKEAISCIAENRPKSYRRRYRRVSNRSLLITRLVRWLSFHAGFRKRFIEGLSRDPALFGRGLDIMDGNRSLLRIGLFRCSRLLSRLPFL